MRKKITKRMRKSTKIAYICVSIICFVIAFYGISKQSDNIQNDVKTKEIYNYTNKFDYKYKLNLISNDFIPNYNTDSGISSYVTGLIDTTDVELNYEYIGSENSTLTGTYSVGGRMDVVYTRDGEEQKIWEEDETLVEEKEINTNNNKYDINENINIELQAINKRLEQFQQKMGMSVDAKYTIILRIDINTNVDGQNITNSFKPTIEIELGQKTTQILGDNNIEKTEYISKEYNESVNKKSTPIVIYIVLIIIGLALLRYVFKYKTAHIVKDEYRHELNRILKLCQDKIVQVNSKPDADLKNLVVVKDFGEIVKVSEELFKPILYYRDNANDEACFYVVTGNVTYSFTLNRDV